MTTGNETISTAASGNVSVAGKTVFVVGATSSLASAICHVLAAQGYGLTLSGRDEEELDLLASDLVIRHNIPCTTLAADFTADYFTAESFLASAGACDHILIATGTMGSGDPLSLTDIAFTSHINYTLPAQIATLAAIALSEKGGGSIAILSSVAGDRGRRSNYAYGAAKAALTAFASGLRNYFHRHGVHVMTVKPGFIDTPMTWGQEKINQSKLIASREYAAQKIVEALHERRDVVYVPFFWRYIMMVICAIPEWVFKRLKL